jgi:DNA-binding transcriptional MerR regulator
MRTVKEVSNLTGVSVRTLHYYDEIGLLKPSEINDAGYRLYDDRALETLQQILFFKEFDMPLKSIMVIMDNPNFDKKKTLIDQQEILRLKRERLDGLISLIDSIVKGDNTMSFQEFSKVEIEDMFQSMLANMNEEQLEVITKTYGDVEHYKEQFVMNAGSEKAQGNFKKMVEWYGSKEEMSQVVKNPNSSEVIKSYQNRIHDMFQKLSKRMGEDVKSFEVKTLIGEYEFVSKQLYQMKDVKALLLELANEYKNNVDLIKANDQQYGKGSSLYIGEAIIQFYQ